MNTTSYKYSPEYLIQKQREVSGNFCKKAEYLTEILDDKIDQMHKPVNVVHFSYIKIIKIQQIKSALLYLNNIRFILNYIIENRAFYQRNLNERQLWNDGDDKQH